MLECGLPRRSTLKRDRVPFTASVGAFLVHVCYVRHASFGSWSSITEFTLSAAIQIGRHHPVTGLTNQPRGRSLPPVTMLTRRAGCHESGLSSSTEARGIKTRCGANCILPISAFYPMAMRPEAGRRRHSSSSTKAAKIAAHRTRGRRSEWWCVLHEQDKSPHGVRTTVLRDKSGASPVRFVQRWPAWGASSFVRSGTGPQSGSAFG